MDGVMSRGMLVDSSANMSIEREAMGSGDTAYLEYGRRYEILLVYQCLDTGFDVDFLGSLLPNCYLVESRYDMNLAGLLTLYAKYISSQEIDMSAIPHTITDGKANDDYPKDNISKLEIVKVEEVEEVAPEFIHPFQYLDV